MNRREFCVLAGGVVASACSDMGFPNDGRLSARPRTGVKTSATGQIMLGLDRERDAVLQIPKSATSSPLPLLVMLHGATQSAEDMFWYLGSTHEEADVAPRYQNMSSALCVASVISDEDMFWYLGSTHEEADVAVLAPNSRGTTWDAIRNT